MKHEHDEFTRLQPSLDKALREQIKAPLMDAAFRQQVFARIAAQRSALARAAASPSTLRARLRAQLWLKVLNLGAMAVAGMLLLGIFGPQLGALVTRLELAVPGGAAMLDELRLPLAMTVAGVALVFGLHRARLLGWVRTLDI